MDLAAVSNYLKLQKHPNHTEVIYNGAPCLVVMESSEGYTWAVIPLFARMIYGANTYADIPYAMESFGDMEEAIADGISKLHELGAFIEYDIDSLQDDFKRNTLQECTELAVMYSEGNLLEAANYLEGMIEEAFAHPNHKKLDKNKNGKLDKEDFQILRGEKKTPVAEAAYEKDLDPEKKIVVTGVKGAKSTPFKKSFKNMAHYEKFCDSEDYDNHEVHQVRNESADDTDAEQLDEASAPTGPLKHRISVIVSQPDHTAVSMRKEQEEKRIKISSSQNLSKEDAIARAKKHYKMKGYKVHSAEHIGMVSESEEQLDEVENAFTSVFGPKKTTSSYDLPGHAVIHVKSGPNGETHVKRISKEGHVTTTKYSSSGAAVGKIKHDDEDPKPHFKAAGIALADKPKLGKGRPPKAGHAAGASHEVVKAKIDKGETLSRYEKYIAQKHNLMDKGKAGRKGKELDDAGSEKLFKTLALRSLKKAEKGMKTEEVEQIEEVSEWESRHSEFTKAGNDATDKHISEIKSKLKALENKSSNKKGTLNSIFGKRSTSDLGMISHSAKTLSNHIDKNKDAKLGTDERKELGQHLIYAKNLLAKHKDLYEEAEQIEEKITADTPTKDVIKDFIGSDAPQFKGKSKAERIRMALGAVYSAREENGGEGEGSGE